MQRYTCSILRIFSLSLQNTSITDKSVQVVERYFLHLTHFGVDSCRGISRHLRQKYALKCHSSKNAAYEHVVEASNAHDFANQRRPAVSILYASKRPRNALYELDEDYDDRSSKPISKSQQVEETIHNGKSSRTRHA